MQDEPQGPVVPVELDTGLACLVMLAHVQQAWVYELLAAKNEAERRQKSVLARIRRSMLDLQHEAEHKVAALGQELKNAEQQLAIHTVSGVVTEAELLMVIVSSGQPVEIEAMLENKDIGFVRASQAGEVKVETFNFTKCGMIDGTVLSISWLNMRARVVVQLRVQLKNNSIQVGGQRLAVSSDMTMRAEVQADKRERIDSFLSPLQEYVDESMSASFIWN